MSPHSVKAVTAVSMWFVVSKFLYDLQFNYPCHRSFDVLHCGILIYPATFLGLHIMSIFFFSLFENKKVSLDFISFF